MIHEINSELETKLRAETVLKENLERSEMGDEIVESATGLLGKAKVSLESGNASDELLETVAVLMLLLDENVAAAIGFDERKFNTVARFTGENSKVDTFMKRVANHPSFTQKIQQIVEELKSGDESNLNALNKARLQYERLAAK